MPEYITKDQVADMLKRTIPVWLWADPKFGVAEWLKNMPAADVAPVVHAKWVWRSDLTSLGYSERVVCSHCRCELRRFGELEGSYPPYCERCGAIMDADKDKDKPEPKEAYPGENEVAEMVRCKDCMYGEKDRFNRILCHWFGDDESMPAVGYEDFCSHGRRKDDHE